jgi:hypothetical protein
VPGAVRAASWPPGQTFISAPLAGQRHGREGTALYVALLAMGRLPDDNAARLPLAMLSSDVRPRTRQRNAGDRWLPLRLRNWLDAEFFFFGSFR